MVDFCTAELLFVPNLLRNGTSSRTSSFIFDVFGVSVSNIYFPSCGCENDPDVIISSQFFNVNIEANVFFPGLKFHFLFPAGLQQMNIGPQFLIEMRLLLLSHYLSHIAWPKSLPFLFVVTGFLPALVISKHFLSKRWTIPFTNY